MPPIPNAVLVVSASCTILAVVVALAHGSRSKPINRHALVSRQDVVLTAVDTNAPLQVGNGQFAFGMDATGLQAFVPFNTTSDWGWSNSPLPANLNLADFHGQVWNTHGRPERYWMPDPAQPELSGWLAANPHLINLGRVGSLLTKRDGSYAVASDITGIRQTLVLWSVVSRF